MNNLQLDLFTEFPINRYVISRELGVGAFGMVHLYELKEMKQLLLWRLFDHNITFNTASSEKGTTLKVANSEFQFFGYYVMGPYE